MKSSSYPCSHTQRARRLTLILGLVFAVGAGVAGCEGEAPQPHTGGDESPHVHEIRQGDRPDHTLRVVDGLNEARAVLAAGPLTVEPDRGELFWRAGLRYETTAGDDPELEYRVERNGAWTAWAPVEVTWHEEVNYNGRVLLDAPAERIQFRPTARSEHAELDFIFTELYPEPLPEAATQPTPQNELQGDDPRYATLEQALAPPGFVNLRASWGARAARNSGSCLVAHTPRYLTVHHTVGPNNDTTSPEARMRGIQNYHMDSNGWCDIGYHFVVSQDGRIWQARESHDELGIHVGGNNTDNVGISFMGSYHIAEVPDVMIQETAPLFAWFRDNYGIPLTRNERVFGHREWGNSTACPGQYLLPRIQEIIDIAENANADDGVEIRAAWSTIPGQARDLVPYGSSASKFDAILGQELTGHITVRNGVDRPATDDMVVGYWIQDPYLTPLGYTIKTDRPSKDGQTFVDSSENGRSDNPDASNPPVEGNIHVGSVEPGESVRIEFRLRANRYSIGKVDHPDLRGWVKHIGNYYGEQDGWGDDVEVNQAGRLLRHYAELDVFSPHEWQFDGGDGDDVEGWNPASGIDPLAINTTDDALAMKAVGTDPQITSPAWTSIDADRMTEIVIRARQHGGERTSQLFWAHDGESFSEARSITFTTPGDSNFAVYTLDLSGETGWDGTITQLRFDPWDGGPFDAAPSWFDIDYILFAEGDVPVDDVDGDGATSDVDCDDTDPTAYPGASEICDGVDNDCNGETDEIDGCMSQVGDAGGEDMASGDATQGDMLNLSDGGPTAPDAGNGSDGMSDAGTGNEPGLTTTDAGGDCGCRQLVGSSDERNRDWPLGGALLGLAGLVFWRRRMRG